MKAWTFIIIGLAILYSPPFASATVAYSTVSDSTTYGPGSYAIAGSNAVPYGYFQVANRFVPMVSGNLSGIELGLGYLIKSDQIDVSLQSDANYEPNSMNSFPSGVDLFTSTVTTTFADGSGTALLSLTPPITVPLNAGTRYWLVIKPHTSLTFDGWGFAEAFPFGGVAYSYSADNAWRSFQGRQNAFRIDVVPEPSVLTLTCVGLTMLVKRKLIDGK